MQAALYDFYYGLLLRYSTYKLSSTEFAATSNSILSLVVILFPNKIRGK